LAFIALFGIKLAPIYIENFTIRSVLTGLENHTGTFSGSEDVRSSIEKRFGMNNVTNVKASEVIIQPLPGNGYSLQLDYERRVPFIHNISIVVDFSETAEVRGGGAIAQ
jgi:hypothetical protein